MHTTRKKKVALFACSEVCGSNASWPWLLSPSAGITGVLLSFLMSYRHISAHTQPILDHPIHLLERLVVDKTGGILWNLQLPLLDVLAELPRKASRVSGLIFGSQAGARCSLPHDSPGAELKGLHRRGMTYMVVAG